MHPYIFKKVLVTERIPSVGLKVVSPGLWVVGDVTDTYSTEDRRSERCAPDPPYQNQVKA
jgi:hypothetical protein